MSEAPQGRSLKQRLLHEVEEYGTIFLYLYIAFATVIFYRDAVLRAQGIALASYGFALVKALVLAKFMVIGQAVRIGERVTPRRRIVTALFRSSAFLVLLILLSVIEEALVGAIRGRGALHEIEAMGGGNLWEMLATALLLWVILLPYFVLRLIGEALGKGGLRRMFFHRN